MKTKRILSGGIATIAATFLVGRGADAQFIPITGPGTYTQDFNTLPTAAGSNWFDDSTLPAWYATTDNPLAPIPLAIYNTGGASARGFFSAGSGTERSLAWSPTSTNYSVTAMGLVFKNDTTSPVRFGSFNYKGELYVAHSVANTLDGFQFFYQIGNVAITNLGPFTSNNGGDYATNAAIADAGWTRYAALDYARSHTATGVQNPPLITDVGVADAGLVLNPGQFITFRWRNPNDTGTDAVMGIDDLSISYSVIRNLIYNLGHSVGTAPDGVLAVTANQYWLDGVTPIGFSGGENVAFSQNGSAVIDVPTNVSVSVMSVSNSSGTYTVGGAGSISGSLTKSNAGTLVLTAANNFSSVSASGGTIATSNAAALGSGPVALSGTGVTLQTNTDLALSGAVSGAGGITKTGAGTLTLGGANTYTGQTVVNEGTLRVIGSLALNHQVSVNAGEIQVNGIVNAGSTVSVANAAVLSGSGTVNGSATISNGGIVRPGVLGVGTLTLQNLFFGGAATIDYSLTSAVNVTGVNSLVANGAAGSVVVNVTGAPVVGNTYTVLNYNGFVGGTGAGAFVLGSLPNRVTGTLADNTLTTAIELTITGLDFPVWTGALNSAWTTAVQGVPKNWALNSNALPTDFVDTDSVLFNDSAANAAVAINNGDVTPSLVTFDNSTNAYVLSGVNGIAGAAGIVKGGTGTVTIGNVNSFTGGVTVNLGTVSVGAITNSGVAGPLGAGAAIALNGGALEFTGAAGSTNRAITVGASGGRIKVDNSLTLTGSISGIGGLTKSGTGTLVVTGTSTHALTTIQEGTVQVGNGGATGSLGAGPVLNDATLVFDFGSGTTVTNGIGGAGNVEKRGAGDVTFAGTDANTYGGTTTIVAGTLFGGKTGGNAIGGDLVINGGATFRYVGDTAANQIADFASITVNGGTFGNPLGAPAAGSTDSVLNVTLNSGAFGSGRTTTATPFTVSGLFKASAGSLVVAQRGGSIFASTMELSATTVDLDGGSTTVGQESRITVGFGGLSMTDSVINFNSPKAAYAANSVGSILVLNGDVTTTGTNSFVRFNNTQTAPVSNVDLGGVDRTFDVTGTLTIGSATAQVSLVNGNLVKTGSGALNVFGSQPALGNVTVNAGRFVFDGLIAAPLVAANTGGTFAGLGTANSAVTLGNGGIIEAGIGGSGALTINSLTFGSGAGDLSVVNVTRNVNPAIINVLGFGGLTINSGPGTITVNVSGLPPGLGQHVLIDYAGTIQGTGGAASFIAGTLPNRVIGTIVDDSINSTINLNVTSVDNPVWTGALDGVWTETLQSAPKNWVLASAPGTTTDFLIGDSTIFNDSSNVLTVSLTDVDVSPSAARFENITKDYTLAGTRAIAGTAVLLKQGAGTLTVTNSNTFTGEVRLNGGVISVASLENSGVAGPLGAGTTLAFDGGTLLSTALAASTNRTVILGAGGGIIRTDANVMLAGAVSGVGSMEKLGTGTLVLAGANGGFNGGITITQGTVQYSSPTPDTATIGGVNQIITLNGGTLEYTGTVQQSLNNATVFRQLDSGTVGGTISVPVATGAIQIEIANSILNSGTLTKTGPGTLRITSDQLNFTGDWVVDGGSLEATQTGGAFGFGDVKVNTGGVVVLRGSANPVILPNDVNLNGGALGVRSGDLGVFAGNVDVTADSFVNLKSNTTPANAQSLTVSGLLSGASRLEITGNVPLTNGGKAFILTNPANTFSGTYGVSQFQGLTSDSIGGGNALGTGIIEITNGTLNLRDNGTGNNGILAYGNAVNLLGTTAIFTVDRPVGGSNTGNTFQLGALTADAQTITVTGANQYNIAFTGGTLSATPTINAISANVALAGTISGAGGITKTGGSALVIAGNHTFSGTVDVLGGTLAGAGSIAGPAALNTGTTLEPGILGPGILGIGSDLAFATGATFRVDVAHGAGPEPIAGADYDQVVVGTGTGPVSTGSVSLNSATLSLTVGAGLQLGDRLFIIVNDGTDAVSGTFLGLPNDTIFSVGGADFLITYDANFDLLALDGGNDVALEVVPEPGSAALLLGGLALLAARRRRE